MHVASWREGYAGLVDPAILAARDADERAAAWHGYLAHVPTFVAERGGELAGFASLAIPARSLHEPATGEITAFYVDPSHWRRGVGRALFAVAREHLRDAGCEQLVLWVLEGNDVGREFYASLGLEPDGTRAVDDHTGLPELLLRAPLAA